MSRTQVSKVHRYQYVPGLQNKNSNPDCRWRRQPRGGPDEAEKHHVLVNHDRRLSRHGIQQLVRETIPRLKTGEKR
jgi:hypothetical protein